MYSIYRDSHVRPAEDLLALPGQAGCNLVSALSHQEDTLISYKDKLYLIRGAALLHWLVLSVFFGGQLCTFPGTTVLHPRDRRLSLVSMGSRF
ncbi:MAG TPA: hypothetical protein PKN99_11820 [Cyclobacteriaceae bacterium]|nr:hypothetical protein [Cyclobacteriaceae bacterium]